MGTRFVISFFFCCFLTVAFAKKGIPIPLEAHFGQFVVVVIVTVLVVNIANRISSFADWRKERERSSA